MHWVVQNNISKEPVFDDCIKVFEKHNIPYSLHKVIPFVGEILPDINPEGPVICLGSYSMRHVAKQKNWSPGVYDLGPITFVEQMKHWSDLLLNSDSVVCKFQDAVVDSLKFIRPIEDSKLFGGKLITPEEFAKWRHSVVDLKEDYGYRLMDTMIQVSNPKTIYSEYRYWIVRNRIAAKSMYRRGSKLISCRKFIDKRFDSFVNYVIAPFNWSPHEAYCLDVCDTPDGIKIVEINTINACGFMMLMSNL
jgi:hypothetical protein